jgi:hypothetical protein
MQATQYLQPINPATATQPSWMLLEAQLRVSASQLLSIDEWFHTSCI